MSDADSESTDSENNNVSPLFNPYFGIQRLGPFEYPENEDLEIDDSSSDESNPQFVVDLASSSTSDVRILVFIINVFNHFLLYCRVM